MNSLVLFVLAITMDARTGDVSSTKPVSGPFDSVEACSAAQVKTNTQLPKDGKITVYMCGVLPQGDQAT